MHELVQYSEIDMAAASQGQRKEKTRHLSKNDQNKAREHT
jgi:hypothetical protein